MVCFGSGPEGNSTSYRGEDQLVSFSIDIASTPAPEVLFHQDLPTGALFKADGPFTLPFSHLGDFSDDREI